MEPDRRWPRGRARDGGIDRIPVPAPRGGLSLCGKHAVGPDPEGALARAGASTIVCLVQRHEIAVRYPAYVDWLAVHATGPNGGRALWAPIPDLHALALPDTIDLVGALRARLGAGEHLLVHCAAGIGRAGTIATCVLMDLGLGLDEALAVVAGHRPMAGPEVGAQRDLVEAFAATVGTGRSAVDDLQSTPWRRST